MPVGSDRSGGYEDETEYGEGAQFASPAAAKAYEALVVSQGTKSDDPLLKGGEDGGKERDDERESGVSPDGRSPRRNEVGAGFSPNQTPETEAPMPDPETPEAERKLGLKRVWKQVGAALVVVVVAVGGYAATQGGDSKKASTGGGAPTTAAPAGDAERYEGTSSRIGCITCDGKHRYISIENNATLIDDAGRAATEMVWPENGTVTDFGVTINGANKGNYGVNLFVNGDYSVGCQLPPGKRTCKMAPGSAPLSQGDRVTIIVGEAGTIVDGKVASQGKFTMSWYFDFVASSTPSSAG